MDNQHGYTIDRHHPLNGGHGQPPNNSPRPPAVRKQSKAKRSKYKFQTEWRIAFPWLRKQEVVEGNSLCMQVQAAKTYRVTGIDF